TLPECRANWLDEVALRHEIALFIHGDRQLWQCTCSWSEDWLTVVQCVELRLVAWTQDSVGLSLIKRGWATDVSTNPSVRVVIAVVEVFLTLTLSYLLRIVVAQTSQHTGVAVTVNRVHVVLVYVLLRIV